MAAKKGRKRNDMSAARAALAARRNALVNGEVAQRELEAMQQVTKVISALPNDSRRAVLDYVERHYGD